MAHGASECCGRRVHTFVLCSRELNLRVGGTARCFYAAAADPCFAGGWQSAALERAPGDPHEVCAVPRVGGVCLSPVAIDRWAEKLKGALADSGWRGGLPGRQSNPALVAESPPSARVTPAGTSWPLRSPTAIALAPLEVREIATGSSSPGSWLRCAAPRIVAARALTVCVVMV